MKTMKRYFPAVHSFESVDQILQYYISSVRFWVLSTLYFHVVKTFFVCGRNLELWPFKCRLMSHTFMWYRVLCLQIKLVQYNNSNVNFWTVNVLCGWNLELWPFKYKLLSSTFPRCWRLSVDEILKCDHSKVSFQVILPWDANFQACEWILQRDHSNRSY